MWICCVLSPLVTRTGRAGDFCLKSYWWNFKTKNPFFFLKRFYHFLGYFLEFFFVLGKKPFVHNGGVSRDWLGGCGCWRWWNMTHDMSPIQGFFTESDLWTLWTMEQLWKSEPLWTIWTLWTLWTLCLDGHGWCRFCPCYQIVSDSCDTLDWMKVATYWHQLHPICHLP